MCTAISYKTADVYFGRTLDIECSYGEEVIVAPRNFSFDFRHTGAQKSHHAIIGMGTVRDGYPLYYEAANECGLGMAGLNFPLSCKYMPQMQCKENVTPFELIPWLLCSCKNVSEARDKLTNTNLVNIPFSEEFPLSPLHWILVLRCH